MSTAEIAGPPRRSRAAVHRLAASVGAGADDERRARASAQAALAVFVVFVVVAFPLVMFGLGSFQWFLRDDWAFITDRRAGSLRDLFRSHQGHWSTLPILTFRGLWTVFGARTYRPYQAVVLALHLTTAVLLRVVMRRAGVGPWIATAAAAVFVLFGPGAEDIIWAFQMGFTGSVAFGLAALILVDHRGSVGGRDALAIGAGALSLMCSGVGIVMVVIVGLATLIRRGWWAALVNTVPLGLVFGIYWLVERPGLVSIYGRPSIEVIVRWVRSGAIGTFRAIGHYPAVAILLAVLLVVGWVLVVVQPDGRSRRRLAAPFSLLAGGLVFSALTAEGRWYLGEQAARAGRYLYVGAAFVLPALAVAADAVAHRWKAATPVLVLLLLIAVPANIGEFDDTPFGASYFAAERGILTSVTRVPAADQVPRSVRPIPDAYLPPGLTIGFLRDAQRQGRLPVSTHPLTAAEAAQLTVRLGVAQMAVRLLPPTCDPVAGPVDIDPPKGAVYRFTSPLLITPLRGKIPQSKPVAFAPVNGQQLTIELAGMQLRVSAPALGGHVALCRQS